MNINLNKPDISSIKSLNYRDLIIFLIPFIIFSIYLGVYNPGILTFDTFNQFHQIATNNFNNWHPFFHTFIEMMCLKVYPSPISVAVLQILVFSTMWMIICKYHRDDSVKNNTFLIQAIITLVICLIPLNAIFSITLWKDILYSYNLMFLCFLVKVLVDRKGELSFTLTVAMALIMAFVAQLRMNGFYVIILLLIFLTAYLIWKYGFKKIYIALPALTVIFILLIASLNVAYDVTDNQKDFFFVKTSHMLADYDLHLDLDDADRQKVHKLMDKKKIGKDYNIYYSDPISRLADKDVFDNDTMGYLKIAAKYSIKHPDRFLFYIFKSSDIVWDITRDLDWNKPAYRIWEDGARVEENKQHYYEYKNATPEKSYEDVHNYNKGTLPYSLLTSYVYGVRANVITDTIFNSPALYMFMAIILLIVMRIITKSRELYLVYVPNLLNIILIFGSIPAQNNGYLYGNFLVFYLLVIIFLSILKSPKQKSEASYL